MDSHEPVEERTRAEQERRSTRADFSEKLNSKDEIIKGLTEGNLNVLREFLKNVTRIIITLNLESKPLSKTNAQMLEKYTTLKTELKDALRMFTSQFESYDRMGNTDQIQISADINTRTSEFESTLQILSEEYLQSLSTEGGKRKSNKRKFNKRKSHKHKSHKRK